MTITIRPAITSEAKPLVGLYSESGKGKTYSALLLAKGFVAAQGAKMSSVAMIETESGRGEAYADDPVVGGYRVISMREDFSPKNYGAAISLAERENVLALIVDSASHEWEGVGGVLAMAAKNQEDGKKGVLVWQQPKIQHQREFMLRLLQTPIPLIIVCMRAKFPMYQVTQADLKKWEEAGRPGQQPKVGDWARAWALEPKQSDDILFEMFVHGWIDEKHNFRGTKYTTPAMRDIFADGNPISVETGTRLAAWAAGDQSKESPQPSGAPAEPREAPTPAGAPEGGQAAEADDLYIAPEQVVQLETKCKEAGVPVARLCAAAKVSGIKFISRVNFQRALDWVTRKAAEATQG